MPMKRLLIALSLLVVPGVALAFDPAPAAFRDGIRVGILRAPDAELHRSGEQLHRTIREALRDELKSRGVDAYVDDADFEQVSRDEARGADFYVEIVGDADTEDYGGVGVGGRHADVSLGVVVSRLAADVYVYEGRSLELVAKESLAKRNTALLPTGVGVGDRNIFAWVALPFIERAQARRVARAVAVDMAARVTDAVRAH